MELEVRHLRLICAIADTGSLSRAAAALQLTQPGVSAQLTRIETMLGGRLFERHPTGVSITDLGGVILARAKAVLPTFDELVTIAAVTPRARSASPSLRLGSVPTPLLAGLIGAAQAAVPHAEITARTHSTAQALIDDISAGRLEAALVGYHPGYELTGRAGVVLRRIVREPLFALLTSTHALAELDEVDLAELGRDAWVVPGPGDRTSEYWIRVLQAHGIHPDIRYEAEGRPLVELVRNGYAVSLCQPTFYEFPGIVVKPLLANPLWTTVAVAWHREGPLAAFGDAIYNYLCDANDKIVLTSEVYGRWRRQYGSQNPAVDLRGSSYSVGDSWIEP